MPDTKDTAPRIGIWPATTASGQQFVDIYADAVAGAGAHVVDVKRPTRLDRYAIDLLHMHWPDQLYWGGHSLIADIARTAGFLRALAKARRRGVKIVWMVHNLDPHDQSPLRALLWRFYKARLCRLVDGWMTVSPATVGEVTRAMPALAAKPCCAPWHPLYPPIAGVRPRDEVRASLGVTGRLYGCLGFLRPYKGIERLIAAFRDLPGRDDMLLIAGKPVDQSYLSRLQEMAAGDARIRIRPESLDDRQFAEFEQACDFMVLPFTKSLHSGSLIHAVSSGVAAITPALPFSRALGTEVGEGWVQLYDGELAAGTLDRPPPSRAEPPRLDALRPEVVGQAAVGFYRSLLEGRLSGR